MSLVKYPRTLISISALLLCSALLGLFFLTPGQRDHPKREGRELMRSELTLQDGKLHASGETTPFTGRMFEIFSADQRKLEIEIRDGRAHGRSRGWYENGQIEVEETFTDGVSHGKRTRWHSNGTMKSVAQITKGEVNGKYAEWHENGQKSLEMTFHNGKPAGLVEAWHPSGALKSQVRFEGEKQVSSEFFPDPALAATSR